MQVVIASNNKGKIKEFSIALAHTGWEIEALMHYPELSEIAETGNSFVENAIIKAETVSNHTGKIAIADDSGITVDALAGAPGIYSARYAGIGASDEENNNKLLNELKKISANSTEQRKAQFVCAIAVAFPDRRVTEIFMGNCAGIVLEAVRGQGGFGYDPLFYIESEGKTMAEISIHRKNEISHRAIALAKMRKFFE